MSLVHTHHVVRCRLTSKVSSTTIFRKHAIPSSRLARRYIMTASQDVDALFPLPPARDDAAPSGTAHLFPGRWPGSSIESSRALINGLKKDYQNFHVFFNDKHFHNHTTHHLFALWSLGADAALIRAAYETNAEEQRPAFASPSPITDSNWMEHLGDDTYYNAYLNFFGDIIRKKGVKAALDYYVLSEGANITKGKDSDDPLMLVRFLDAVIHPMIHLGHGAEFGLPGMVAEGLAWTAVHHPTNASIMPPSVFGPTHATNPSGSSGPGVVASLLGALSLNSASTSGEKGTQGRSEGIRDERYQAQLRAGPHAFTILGKAIKDPLLAPHKNGWRGDLDDICAPPGDKGKDEDDNSKKRRARVVELAEEWAQGVEIGSGPDSAAALEAKVEELAWMNALMYGVGGWTPPSSSSGADGVRSTTNDSRAAQHDGIKDDRKEFYADFFIMHCVTSSLFLPSILAHLSADHQTRLLRAYFAVCLAYFVARGRPDVGGRLEAFFKGPVQPLRIPGPAVTPHGSALHPEDDAAAESKDGRSVAHSRNAWHAVLQSTMYHPEAHVSKAQRALAHWSARYGTRPRGYFEGVGLEGAEHIDGSLFVRTGTLTLEKVGWVREGEEAVFWDQ